MSDDHPSLQEYFSEDHRRCDACWAEVEGAAESGSAADVKTAWQRFEAAQRRHLRMEEEVIFPAFERATGMTGGGPTFVMRAEHDQMRGLLEQMGEAAEAGELDALVDLGDTLLMLIQQHNQKEEHMLYPMSSDALAAEWDALYARVSQM